jgi:hypothetical protein
MANIVISGDSSGSVTLSAPAVSGTTVLTLPTTSGTLVVAGGAQTIEFADGSASAPSITNSGDTNTGIFFPAADTIAFTEGGVESMRIDASGNVGIGTASPSVKVDIAQSVNDTAQAKITNSNSGTSASASFAASNGSQVVQLNIAGSSYGGYGIWQANQAMVYASTSLNLMADSGSGVIKFATGGNAERMRINSGGDVGIGTSSPLERLHIAGGCVLVTGSLQTLRASSSSLDFNGGATRIIGTGADASTYAPIIFANTTSTAYAERMRITSAGNVCIKTTTSINSSALTIGSGAANDSLVICGANGVDGNYVDWLVSAPYGANLAEQNRIRSSISGGAASSGFQFMVSDGFGASTQTQSFRINRTSCTVIGSLSKGSGSFKIDHPLPAKTDTHHLVHSFIEGPQADLIYRGVAELVAGKATVNIDSAAGMTEGTFEALCREAQCFTTNESDWTAVRGKVSGNILTIEAQDKTATSSISWMVIGERKDKHMYDTEWTDDNGKVIVEPLKTTASENT